MVRRLGSGLLRLLRSAPEPTLAGRFTLTFLFLAFWPSLALHNNPVLFVICVILATVLCSALVTHLATSRLEVDRTLPDRVFAGEAFDTRLRVHNRSRWRPALGLGFRDALQTEELAELTCGPTLPVLPPGGTAEVVYKSRIHRRGVHAVTNSLAATRFPFGIFEQRVLIQSPSRIVVLPGLGRLRRGAVREMEADSAAPRTVRRERDGGVEFHGLREYRPGDNPRHIHWKTSAHAMTLMRRVMSDETGDDLVVLLDTRVDGLHAQARRRNLEKAISCAATLLVHAARNHRRAAVHHAAGVARHDGHARGVVPALEALALLEASQLPAADLVARTRLPRSAYIVLISLSGSAKAARAAAERQGARLRVWDVAHARFGSYFTRR